MCKKTLNKDVRISLIRQVRKEVLSEKLLENEEKKGLKKNIYKRIIGYWENASKDINEDLLKTEVKKISYEMISRKILSKELQIEEKNIFVNSDTICIRPQAYYFVGEDMKDAIKRQLSERLPIK
ncbi:TPA: hypothetical protein RZH67_001167, partial [Campylobacter coli]|nr:hypothetical protein [Campylobacter coli]